MRASTPVNRFCRIHAQGETYCGEYSDDRVRAQAARCLTGLLSPKFTHFSSNLKDREHLVESLFTTFDTGPVFVQSEVLHTLSESWI